MDLTELKSRVYSQLRDHDKAFIVDDDVTDWLNEAYSDLAARLDTVEFETTGTTSGASTLAFPTDPSPEVLRPILLRLDTEDVEFVDSDTFYAWADTGATPAHTIAYVFNSVILIHPTPASGITYIFRYTSIPAALSAGTDIPAMPTHMQTKMVRYAQAQAWYKSDEISRGDRAMSEYVQGLPPLPGGMDKILPGPFTLTFEPGPFDIDTDPIHI